MGCNVSEEKLWSWVDRDAPELEAHLAACPACRERAAHIQREIGLIAADSPAVYLPLPEAVGPYRVTRLLGEGGQALVYEAEQPSPRRRVAVKVLKGGRFVSKQHIKHFRRETQTLAALNHPGIATIYDAGRTDDGRHYFAMELVSGASLDAYARDRDLSVEERLKLFRRVCEAVQYAHEHGVIHRDLKPSNILVGESGDTKILDFGLARITSADAGLSLTATQGTVIEGTPRYMSPEQALGRKRQIDERSDVYSLGVILYELLTGSPPHEIAAVSPQTLQTICEESPEPPSRLNSSLKGDLETIVLKALEKSPSRRYPTARALSDDIERYLRGDAIHARPAGAVYLLRKKVRKHRTAAVIAAAALFVVAFGVWRLLQPPYDRDDARRRVLTLRCNLMKNPSDEIALAQARRVSNEYPGLTDAVLVTAQSRYIDRDLRSAIDVLETGVERDRDRWPCEILLHEMRKMHANGPEVAAGGDFPFSARESSETSYMRSLATLDPALALRWSRDAVRRDRDNALALEHLTRLSEITGDDDAALDGASRLIEMGNRPGEWRRYRASLLVLLGRFEEAAGELAVLAESSPVFYHYLSTVHRQLGDYDEAIRDMTAAMDASPREIRTAWQHYHRGTPYWIVGEPEKALEDFRAAYRLLSHATFANVRIFLILNELGRVDEAREALTDAKAHVWNDPWLENVLACFDGGMTPAELVAAADTASAVQLCEGYYYAGEACLLSGDERAAAEWFRRCIATGLRFSPGSKEFPDPMSEYELARWRAGQLASGNRRPLL